MLQPTFVQAMIVMGVRLNNCPIYILSSLKK